MQVNTMTLQHRQGDNTNMQVYWLKITTVKQHGDIITREVEVYGRIALIPMGPRRYPEYIILKYIGQTGGQAMDASTKDQTKTNYELLQLGSEELSIVCLPLSPRIAPG